MQTKTVKELAAALNGVLLCGEEEKEISTLSFDSRQIGNKTLYIPLAGERVDGHQFIQSAFLNGAEAALTEKGEVLDWGKPHIQVKDCKRALQAAGACFRKKKSLPIVAVSYTHLTLPTKLEV